MPYDVLVPLLLATGPISFDGFDSALSLSLSASLVLPAKIFALFLPTSVCPPADA